MSTPFAPFGDPFENPPHPEDFGFGCAPPQQHRDLHEARRQARREFREQLRSHDPRRGGPFGFGPAFGPGFGPGFGFSPPPRGRRRRSGRGHHGRRGDVRAAILLLLTEGPLHGYQMIRQIAERSQDLWRPSPGSVYPTLQMLVDEGLIVGNETDGSKRLFELTEDGRAAAEEIETPPWQEIADGVDPGEVKLRTAVGQLFGAVGQAASAASDEQQQRIVEIVNNARREVYSILSED